MPAEPPDERTNGAKRGQPADADATGAYRSTPNDPDRTGPLHPTDTVHGATRTSAVVPGYEVLSELGRGGMGIVYRAKETSLNRIVALKMVLGADGHAVQRFLAEAAAVAALDHPNVVRVYQYGDNNGQPFMALEYLAGGSLAGKLKDEGALPIRETGTLLRDLARGVAAAHAHGIIHRDLKPANVLLDAEGTPKVADFGLARRGTSDLTQTGAVMGTPAYMAPEQAQGKTKFVGPEADVWALGVILYECVTGVRPFTGEDTWSILRQIISDDPTRPRQLNARMPRDLERICLKCLAKEPHERYRTAGELADDLERFAAGEPVSVRSVGWLERGIKWARRKPTLAGLYAAGVATVLLLFFGSVLGWLWQSEAEARTEADKQRATAEIARGDAETAKTNEASAHAATKQAREELAAQDAMRKIDLAYRAVGDDNALRAVRLLASVDADRRAWEWRFVAQQAQPERRRLWANGGAISNMALAAEAQHCYASCVEGVRVWEPTTGKERLRYQGHKAAVRYVLAHPDGKHVFSASADGAVHCWEQTTQKLVREFRAVPDPELVRLALTTAGDRLAIGNANGVITVWNTATGDRVAELNGHRGYILGVAFLPDGRLSSVGFDGTLRLWDVPTSKMLGPPMPCGSSLWALAIAPEGKSLFVGDDRGRVRHYLYHEANPAQPLAFRNEFTPHASRVCVIRCRPDGQEVATGSMDRTAKVWRFQMKEATLEMPSLYGGTVEPLQLHRGHISDVTDIAFLPNDQLLTCADATLRLHDNTRSSDARVLKLNTQLPKGAPGFGPMAAKEMRFSADNRFVEALVGRWRRWDTTTGREVTEKAKGVEFFPQASGHSADGQRWADANNRGVQLRSATTVLRSWTKPPYDIAGCVVLPNSQVVTFSLDRGRLDLWDVGQDKPAWGHQAHPTSRGMCLALSPDGTLLATASADRTVKLWNASNGQLVRELKGHTFAVNCVAFSPDGSMLATASSDNTARLWDVASGRELHSLRTHSHYVYNVAFSPDGRRLADASGDGTVVIYDVRTGQEAITLRGHTGEVHRLAFSPDGTKLATSATDGTVRLWDAPLHVTAIVPPWANDSFDPTAPVPKE